MSNRRDWFANLSAEEEQAWRDKLRASARQPFSHADCRHPNTKSARTYCRRVRRARAAQS